MIRIDAELAVGIFVFAGVAFFVLLWLKNIFGRDVSSGAEGDVGSVRQCPYCGHVILDHLPQEGGELVVCPVCQSYF